MGGNDDGETAPAPDRSGEDSDGGDGFRPFGSREWREYTRYHFLVAKFVFFGGIAALLYWCLSSIERVLVPIFISFLFAYLFDPVVDWFEERAIPRSIGILIILFTGLVGLGLFALVLYPTIVDQVEHVISTVPNRIEDIRNDFLPWVEERFDYRIPDTVDEALQRYRESLKDYLPTLANRIAKFGGTVLTSTGAIAGALINLIMIPVFTFYFLRDFDRIRLKLVEFIPERRREFVMTRAAEMDRVVGEWVRGQLQVASILAVLYSIGLSIAFWAAGLKIRAGITVGVLSGLLNFVPYLGVAIGLVLSVVLVVINWSGVLPLLGVLLVFFLVQSLEGYLITPKIVGDKVGLNPVTVIIVLLIGGEVYGLLGFIVAIPLFGALKVLFPDLVRYYKQTRFFTGRGASSAEGELTRDGSAEGANGDGPTTGEESSEPGGGRGEGRSDGSVSPQSSGGGDGESS